MRSIGRKNINLVIRRTKEQVEKQRKPGVMLSDIDYEAVRKNTIEALPVELWDTWEMADQQIRNLIEDETTKYAYGIYK